MALCVILYDGSHQQGCNVRLEVQGSDAGQGDGVGREASQQEGRQRLDGRHQVEHAALEGALWLDDFPCNPPGKESSTAKVQHCSVLRGCGTPPALSSSQLHLSLSLYEVCHIDDRHPEGEGLR